MGSCRVRLLFSMQFHVKQVPPMSLMSGLIDRTERSRMSAAVCRRRSSLKVPKGPPVRWAVASLDRSIHMSASRRQRRSSAADRSRLKACSPGMKGLAPTNQPWSYAHVSRETVCVGPALLSWKPGSKTSVPTGGLEAERARRLGRLLTARPDSLGATSNTEATWLQTGVCRALKEVCEQLSWPTL